LEIKVELPLRSANRSPSSRDSYCLVNLQADEVGNWGSYRILPKAGSFERRKRSSDDEDRAAKTSAKEAF